MKHRFGVAVFCLSPFEDEIQRRLKGNAFVELGGHCSIVRILAVLPIHHHRHSLKGFSYLRFVDDAVVQPVSHMLTRYPQGRSVFH